MEADRVYYGVQHLGDDVGWLSYSYDTDQLNNAKGFDLSHLSPHDREAIASAIEKNGYINTDSYDVRESAEKITRDQPQWFELLLNVLESKRYSLAELPEEPSDDDAPSRVDPLVERPDR